jgi:hypothetical protein
MRIYVLTPFKIHGFEEPIVPFGDIALCDLCAALELEDTCVLDDEKTAHEKFARSKTLKYIYTLTLESTQKK